MRSRLVNILTYTVLFFWVLVCIFPFYWVAVTSLKGEREIGGGPFYLPFLDFMPTLDAWKYLLVDSNDNLLLRYLNSAVVGLTATSLTVLLAGTAIYGLTRFRFALRWTALALGLLLAALVLNLFFVSKIGPQFSFAIAFVLFLFLALRLHRHGPALHKHGILIALVATRILPPVVVVLPIYLMALYTGTLDTRFALIFTYTAANLPVAIWLLQPVLGWVATEQEEAALIDGASRLRIFFEIAVPMAFAGIAAVAVLIFVLCWNEYLFAAYLTGSHAMTLPPWMVGQISVREAATGGDAVEWAHLSAAAVLMILPLLACTGFVQRILGGMLLGSR
jgi:multiple sugar transport system permease protein